MFAHQMSAAINEARTLTRLNDLSKAIWQGFSAHAVTDDQAQSLLAFLRAAPPFSRPDASSGLLCGLWPLPGDDT